MAFSRLPFITIHLLTHRGIENINRDETGRPKTALIDDTLRSYNSSQNNKYNLKKNLANRFGLDISVQTNQIGTYFYNKLIEGKVKKEMAEKYAYLLIGTFVDLKKRKEKEDDKKKKKEKDTFKTETIKIQKTEMDHIDNLIKRIIKGYEPKEEEFHFLKANTAIDIALTGRMIAKESKYSVPTALSANFSFTVNDIQNTQVDYFTATDNIGMEGSKGSSHLNYFYFTQGISYNLYIIDTELLLKNLNKNKKLTEQTICQIIEVLVTSSPEANKNRCSDGITWPEYVMIEKMDITPRSLCSAFMNPVKGPDFMRNSIKALMETKEKFDYCYGSVEYTALNVLEKQGTLKDLIDFIKKIFS